MMPNNCQNCGKPRKWYQLKRANGQGREMLYTAPNGKLVCASCLQTLTGKRPMSLAEINEARKGNNNI